jgi:cyanate permease
VSALAKANLALFVLLALHTLDHAFNQPARDQPGSAALVGIAGFAIVAISMTLAVNRSPRARQASLAAGSVTVIGVFAIHLVPQWAGWVSDPYWDFDANALSWLSLTALLAAAIYVVAVAGRDPDPATA